MLGLTSLEVYNSIFKITNESIKFEITKTFEEKEKQYYLEKLKINDRKSKPEDLIGEFLGPVVVDKLK